MYDAKTDAKTQRKIREDLKWLYSQIPETKGCMECIDKPFKEGGCGAWCCELQTPQVLYCEFLNTWNYVLHNWTDKEITALIGRCLRSYLFSRREKGCVFWNKQTKLCMQHDTRPYNCFLPSTWVMTECGPKHISEILAGDRVFGADGRLHKVVATASRMHTGKIFGIKQQGNHVVSYCTADHRWLASRQKDKRKQPQPTWIEAIDLVEKRGKTEGDYLIFPRGFDRRCVWSGARKLLFEINCLHFVKGETVNDRIIPFTSSVPKNREIQSIPQKIEVCDDFLFMIGLYLAEGYSSNSSASFCMNKNEKHYLERIEKYLNSLSIRTHYATRKNNLILRVDSCLFGRLLKSLCGELAANKAVSPYLFEHLTEKEKLKIFESWSIGDGRKPDKIVAHSVTTISERLAVQMQQILLENGIYPRIQKYHSSKRGFDSWAIMVNRSSLPDWHPVYGQGSKIMYDETNIYAPLDSKEEVLDYSGPVIDIQVEDVESFITASGVVHNCRVYGITPDEEFKPRYERLKVIYPHTRPQCDKVSTVNGQPVTVEDTTKWWGQLNGIEIQMGVDPKKVNDEPDGSYRTYHDHILLHILGEEGLASLSQIRQSGDLITKENTYRNVMKAVEGFGKKAKATA